MSNVAIFRNTLNQRDIHMEEVNDEGGVFFRTRQSIDGGGNVILVALFNDREDIIDLNVFNVASITNPLKKEAVHALINELNNRYRFTKFVEEDNRVFCQYSYQIDDNFNADRALNNLLMLLQAVEEAYPKFMKLQWS